MSLFTKQKETDRHRKQTYGYQWGKGRREDKLGVGINLYTTATIYKINKEQSPTAYHRGLYSVFCNNL